MCLHYIELKKNSSFHLLFDNSRNMLLCGTLKIIIIGLLYFNNSQRQSLLFSFCSELLLYVHEHIHKWHSKSCMTQIFIAISFYYNMQLRTDLQISLDQVT